MAKTHLRLKAPEQTTLLPGRSKRGGGPTRSVVVALAGVRAVAHNGFLGWSARPPLTAVLGSGVAGVIGFSGVNVALASVTAGGAVAPVTVVSTDASFNLVGATATGAANDLPPTGAEMVAVTLMGVTALGAVVAITPTPAPPLGAVTAGGIAGLAVANVAPNAVGASAAAAVNNVSPVTGGDVDVALVDVTAAAAIGALALAVDFTLGAVAGTGATGDITATGVSTVSVPLGAVSGAGTSASLAPALSVTPLGVAGASIAGTLTRGVTKALTGVAAGASVGTLVASNRPALVAVSGVGTGAALRPGVTVALTGVTGTGAANIVTVMTETDVAFPLVAVTAAAARGTLTPGVSKTPTAVTGAGAVTAVTPTVSLTLGAVTGTGLAHVFAAVATDATVPLVGVTAAGAALPVSTGGTDATIALVSATAAAQVATFVLNLSQALAAVTGAGQAAALPGNPRVAIAGVAAGSATNTLARQIAVKPTAVTATGFAGVTLQPAQPALSAEITFPGGVPTAATLVYDMANGVDMGNYIAPTAGFTQRCLRVRNAGLANYFVDFRPDLSGTRTEVVLWNGETDPTGLTVPGGYSRDLPSYTAVIKQAGVAINTTKISAQPWGCRWRYQTASRPEIRTRAQIFSENWLFGMDPHAARKAGNNLSTGQAYSGVPYAGVIVPPAPQSMNASYVPFGPPCSNDNIYFTTTLTAGAVQGATTITLASVGSLGHSVPLYVTLNDGATFCTHCFSVSGLTVTMNDPLPGPANSGNSAFTALRKFGFDPAIDDTGERVEIGLITEWVAADLISSTSATQDAIYKQAEMWSSEIHFFLPDVQTGACVNQKRNLASYKSMTLGRTFGGFYEVGSGTQWGNWDLHEDETHIHGFPYIQYALTEDPYFLEAIQYIAHWGIGYDITGRTTNNTAQGGAATGVQVGYGNLPADPTGNTGLNGPFTCCAYLGETRNYGWAVRNIVFAWKTALPSPPSWLLPKSYYAALSSDYSKVLDWLFRTDATTTWSVFRCVANPAYWQSFEESYAAQSMAFADLLGAPTASAPTWHTQLLYWSNWLLQETSGLSGWNRQVPLIHDLRIDGTENPFVVLASKTTWGQLWSAMAAFLQTGAPNPTAPAPGRQSGGSVGNESQLYAAAAMMVAQGVPGAATAKSWLDLYVDYNYPNGTLGGVAFANRTGYNGATGGATQVPVADSQEAGGVGHHSTASPLTWSFTNSGGNALLLGVVVTNNVSTAPTISSVTYNGVAAAPLALTLVPSGSATISGAGATILALYYLLNPNNSANTVTVNFAGGAGATAVDCIAGALSFSQALSPPVGTAVSATGTGTTASVALAGTTAGKTVLSLVAAGQGVTSASSPTTLSWLLNVGTSTSGDNAALGRQVSGGGTVTPSFTVSNGPWGIIAVEIK